MGTSHRHHSKEESLAPALRHSVVKVFVECFSANDLAAYATLAWTQAVRTANAAFHYSLSNELSWGNIAPCSWLRQRQNDNKKAQSTVHA